MLETRTRRRRVSRPRRRRPGKHGPCSRACPRACAVGPGGGGEGSPGLHVGRDPPTCPGCRAPEACLLEREAGRGLGGLDPSLYIKGRGAHASHASDVGTIASSAQGPGQASCGESGWPGSPPRVSPEPRLTAPGPGHTPVLWAIDPMAWAFRSSARGHVGGAPRGGLVGGAPRGLPLDLAS